MDNQSHNLTIPRGAALFAKFLPGTQTPGPLRDLGNCPEVTLNRTNEVLPHDSSKAGVRTKDAEISLSGDLGGLILPHPRAAERLFVMGPLAEIAPDWTHPGGGRADALAGAATVGRDARPL